jgi:hypothetical protein
MGVAKGVHPQTRQEVEVALAVYIEKINALAARESQWVTGISVQQVSLLQFSNFLI